MDYEPIATLIQELKLNEPKTYTRLYRLCGEDFDRVLSLIQDGLKPLRGGGRGIIPPIIILAVA